MKCPLGLSVDYGLDDEFSFHAPDCLEEECAWWVKSEAWCAIFALAHSSSTWPDMLRRWFGGRV